jgi:hypothetical protein
MLSVCVTHSLTCFRFNGLTRIESVARRKEGIDPWKEAKKSVSQSSVLQQRETWIHEQGIQDSGRNISWPYIRSYGRLARLRQR